MKNADSSTRKWNISTAKKIPKEKPIIGGQVLCVYVSDVIMLWMNYTWTSLFSWHHFSSLEKYSSVYVYRFNWTNWTNWTIFIHINHIYQVPTAPCSMLHMCCMLFVCVCEIKLHFPPNCLPLSVKYNSILRWKWSKMFGLCTANECSIF